MDWSIDLSVNQEYPMVLDDDDRALAKQEANDTFSSITVLDSICDTTIVAITFLLTELVGWVGFALPRIQSTDAWSTVIILILVSAGFTFCNVHYIVKSLSPRAFYYRALLD